MTQPLLLHALCADMFRRLIGFPFPLSSADAEELRRGEGAC